MAARKKLKTLSLVLRQVERRSMCQNPAFQTENNEKIEKNDLAAILDFKMAV